MKCKYCGEDALTWMDIAKEKVPICGLCYVNGLWRGNEASSSGFMVSSLDKRIMDRSEMLDQGIEVAG